jgi:putative hydrolase of the HAD superfamily
LPPERIEPQAVELMLTLRSQKGPHILKPDAATAVVELHRRGYRLGVISNTTSTADLPRFIEKWGLQKYFEVVILSSVCGVRKPNPEIFWEATRAMRLEPAQCAYLGNKISSDVIGARRAGFSIAMILEPGTGSPKIEKRIVEKPDVVIHGLLELLDIFPSRA